MLRIGLFLLTNIAILLLASIILSLLGFDSYMAANNIDLNLQALLIWCAVLGFGGAFASLFLSKWMAKRSTRTAVIEQPRTQQERWLLDTVAQLARKAGIGMPEVGIFPSSTANAFATGWHRNHALVAVSAGLLERFQPDAAKAVLAHEIGHIANGDMITLTLIQGIVNTFVLFFARIIGHTVDRLVFKTQRGHGIGYFVITFIAQIVLGILASMIVLWFSRWREFRADAAGAKLSSRPAMISALQHLQAEQRPKSMPDQLAAFGIRGDIKHRLTQLLMTHPPLTKRIAALHK